MPYNITWKPGGVIWTFHGILTGQDGVKANLDIYGDPRFDDLQYGIVDLSKVKQFDLTGEDVEAAAALDEAATITNPRLILAIVAHESEAVKFAELYKSAMSESSWKVEIFQSMEDAEEWVRLACQNRG
jgi:hypothetical protein